MPKPSLVLALCVALALPGCSEGCGDDARQDALTAVEAPRALLADVSVQGTDALLRGLAEQSQSSAATVLLPKTAGDLAGRLSGLPVALLEEIPVGAAMHVVVVARDEGPATALAIAMPRTVTLSAAIPSIEGGPHGSHYLFERPGADDDAQARTDDAVVWASSPALLEELLPYAVAGLPTGGAPAVKLVLPEGVAGGPLRSALERGLDAFVSDAKASLEAERAAHEAPPALGDPEVALTRLDAWLRGMLAYLPDIEKLTATLSASPTGTQLDVDLPVRDGTPLARALEAAPVGPAWGAEALPPSTALALMTRSGEAGPPSLMATLRAIAGERIDVDASAALDDVEAALAQPAGAPSLTVVGGNRRGAFLAYARPAEGGPTSPDFLERLVGVPYVSGLVGAAMGCADGAAPLAREDLGPLVAIPLCPREAPPHPVLLFRRQEPHLAFALGHRPDPHAAPHPAVNELVEGLAGHTDGLFGSYPDAARALEVLDERTLAAIALEPSRLFAAAALFDHPALRGLSETVVAPPIPAPTIIGLSRTDEGARLRASVAPRGIDRFLELGLVAARLLDPTAGTAGP